MEVKTFGRNSALGLLSVIPGNQTYLLSKTLLAILFYEFVSDEHNPVNGITTLMAVLFLRTRLCANSIERNHSSVGVYGSVTDGNRAQCIRLGL
jgi:hypothetical protein